MTCVVLCKIDGNYYLRHIIHGINPTDTIESVREKYYKDFDKLKYHIHAELAGTA